MNKNELEVGMLIDLFLFDNIAIRKARVEKITDKKIKVVLWHDLGTASFDWSIISDIQKLSTSAIPGDGGLLNGEPFFVDHNGTIQVVSRLGNVLRSNEQNPDYEKYVWYIRNGKRCKS